MIVLLFAMVVLHSFFVQQKQELSLWQSLYFEQWEILISNEKLHPPYDISEEEK